jgi:hypothetical protein
MLKTFSSATIAQKRGCALSTESCNSQKEFQNKWFFRRLFKPNLNWIHSFEVCQQRYCFVLAIQQRQVPIWFYSNVLFAISILISFSLLNNNLLYELLLL